MIQILVLAHAFAFGGGALVSAALPCSWWQAGIAGIGIFWIKMALTAETDE